MKLFIYDLHVMNILCMCQKLFLYIVSDAYQKAFKLHFFFYMKTVFDMMYGCISILSNVKSYTVVFICIV